MSRKSSERYAREVSRETNSTWFSIAVFLALACAIFPPAQLNAQNAAGTSIKNPAAPKLEITIPIAPLGYLPPSAMDNATYRALVGLQFLDATHLLFTFQIKPLLHRDAICPTGETQRMVRAVVLDLPSGKVENQADWELYDFNDYVWGLGDGQFLLRSCSQLQLVEASLAPHPFFIAAGTIKEMELSPDRSTIVLEEIGAPQTKSAPSSASASAASSEPSGAVGVRFIHIHPPKILAHSRIPVTASVPIVAQGILEALSAPQNNWAIDLQPFVGAERRIVQLHSFCMPKLIAIANDIFVARACPRANEMEYQAYTLQGSLLWRMPVAVDRLRPQFLTTPEGQRFAIEARHLTHPHAALDALTAADVDGDIIDIYDTRTGISQGTLRTTPVYTAGTNADFSPDGLRIAILRQGAIEIYSLSQLAR